MKLLKIPKILKNKKIVFIAIVVIALIFGIWLFLQPQQVLSPPIPGMILFEGKDCKQCANVDTFIKNNKVEEKIALTRLEVFHNDDNANLLADKAQICGLNADQIGVPFLWDSPNCIIGYIDVISYLRNKIAPK